MDCFVCGQPVHGDPAFVQHHLNQSLSRDLNEQVWTGKPFTASTNLSLPSPATPLSPGSAQFQSDAALALALANELGGGPASTDAAALAAAREEEARERRDRELALALARAQETESEAVGTSSGQSRRASLAGTVETTASERESCPCCEARWADLGLRLGPEVPGGHGATALAVATAKVEDRRRKHVELCLEGREKLVSELGDAGAGLHGVWEDDGTDASLADNGGPSWTGGVGGKDEVQGTSGLVPLLHSHLAKSSSSSYGRTAQAYLATSDVEHISTRLRDWGWGCGYKNAQMLFSSLRHMPCYASLFSPSASSASSVSAPSTSPTLAAATAAAAPALAPIPTIKEWQEMIEAAWRAGHDPPGRMHFNGHLVNSRRWIGTTEVYTAFVWMGVRANIVDFPKVPNGEGTHQSITRWLMSYFTSSSSSVSASSASSRASSPPQNAFDLLTASSGSSIRFTDKQPLYLQHRGHSRTIVGLEIGKAGAAGKGKKGAKGVEEAEMWLLLFDPGKPIPPDLKRAAASLAASSTASTSSSLLPPLKRQKSSPISSVSRGGVGSKPTATDDLKYGDVLKVFRVNMKELKKKEEYQILHIEPGPPLTTAEKAQRKEVKSKVAPQVKGVQGAARKA
ncbi:hypothetical protein JCM10213v2_001007 [Rhodosporidiobolus nylandii]